MVREKIKITLPLIENKTDPPDGVCDLCSGKAYGWWIQERCPVTVCILCETEALNSQRRMKIQGLAIGVQESVFRLFMTAFAILWNLEKEIAEQKRRSSSQFVRVHG